MVGACYVLYGILLFTLIIVQAASALRPFLTSLLSGDKKEGMHMTVDSISVCI